MSDEKVGELVSIEIVEPEHEDDIQHIRLGIAYGDGDGRRIVSREFKVYDGSVIRFLNEVFDTTINLQVKGDSIDLEQFVGRRTVVDIF